MDNRRQNKMASLLQQTMGSILLKDVKNYVGSSVLVSVTSVKVSPDLSSAKFYVSVFNQEDAQQSVDILNASSFEWRKKLGAELKHNLRIIPQIEFFLDDTLEYAQKMNELFMNLKKEDNKK